MNIVNAFQESKVGTVKLLKRGCLCQTFYFRSAWVSAYFVLFAAVYVQVTSLAAMVGIIAFALFANDVTTSVK
jgi:hypothetical protein